MSNFMIIFKTICSELVTTIFKCRRKYTGNRRLDSKVVVITGGNSGLGKETAYELALRGAKVIIASRSMEKSQNAIKDIKQRYSEANVTALTLDVCSLASVREFVKTVSQTEDKIDILFNNAAIPVGPEQKTVDGFEMQLSNYLGHFLLTLQLMPLLKKSSNSRIISASTGAHCFGKIHFENINLRNGAYTPIKSHLQCKLALVLFTRELAKRLGQQNNVKSYCLHPGAVNTKPENLNIITGYLFRLVALNINLGVQTYLYCALDDNLDNESGMYYDNCRRVDRMVTQAVDDNTSEKLWDLSCDLVKLEEQFKI